MKKERTAPVVAAAFVAVSFLFLSPFAEGGEAKPPEFTRWMDPSGLPEPLHRLPSPAGPLSIDKVPSYGSDAAASKARMGRICVVVHEGVYDAVSPELQQYAADLADAGFSVETYVYTDGSPEELRSHLHGLYQEPDSLVGAVLVGEIPYVLYEMMADYGMGTQYDDFPSDLFYMDLDGIWSDTLDDGQVAAGNGKYDTREGDLDLEIWACRVKTDNLPSLGYETDVMIDYFDKNHRYRTGELRAEPTALIYSDDDWEQFAPQDASDVRQLYDYSDVTVVSAAEETTADDYKTNRMTAEYELMFLRSHGTPNGHGFYRKRRFAFDFVFHGDYTNIDPRALFYSLFVCSGGDYTVADNLAATIAFNRDDSGLLAWSSTKTGGMWEDRFFYEALSEGEVFGEAFRRWFNRMQQIYPQEAPSWWYGMVFLGDAALTPLLETGGADVSIFRYESILSLRSDTPDEVFPVTAFPWVDPDNILNPGSPGLVFYRLSVEGELIDLFKEGDTIGVEIR